MKPSHETSTMFVRFNNLTRQFLNRDMHLHTVATDGKASAIDLIRRAEELGLDTIAFTEHVRSDSTWFPRFADEVREAGRLSVVQVLVGAEARIMNNSGELDISDSIRQECDLVLASVHRFPAPGGGYLEFTRVPAEEFAHLEFELAMGFLRYGSGSVLAHPGGMCAKFGIEFSQDLMRQLMREASARDIAIEINSSYMRDIQLFASLAREEDPMISLGSDVHELSDLGNCRQLVMEVL